MSVEIKKDQSDVVTGLGTWTHTTGKTKLYVVDVQSTMIPDSELVITILQGMTTMATSVTPVPGQKSLNLRIILSCTAGDVISVVLSSSAFMDQQLNTVKTIINIGEGQVG